MLYSLDVELLTRPDEATCFIEPSHNYVDDEPLSILLVEDVVSDAILTRIALDKAQVPYKLQTFRRGNELLPRIAELWQHNRELMPDMIMLDLGLPGTDGFEIMERLSKMSPSIRAIPIVILTGHQYFEYACKTYNLWIPAYINKPCKPEKMREILNTINRNKLSSLR